jgi:hypothetical protein
LVVKKLLALLLVAGFLFSLTGCPPTTSAPAKPAGGAAGGGTGAPAGGGTGTAK